MVFLYGRNDRNYKYLALFLLFSFLKKTVIPLPDDVLWPPAILVHLPRCETFSCFLCPLGPLPLCATEEGPRSPGNV